MRSLWRGHLTAKGSRPTGWENHYPNRVSAFGRLHAFPNSATSWRPSVQTRVCVTAHCPSNGAAHAAKSVFKPSLFHGSPFSLEFPFGSMLPLTWLPKVPSWILIHITWHHSPPTCSLLLSFSGYKLWDCSFLPFSPNWARLLVLDSLPTLILLFTGGVGELVWISFIYSKMHHF